MKIYGEAELRSSNWGGLKAALKAPLFFPPLNRLVVGAAGLLPRTETVTRIPVVRDSAVYRTEAGPAVKLLEPHRCRVARDAFWGGGVLCSPADRHVMRSLELLAAQARTFLDIGAYSGLFALVAAKVNPEIECFAFEILPQNYELLVRNVIANDLVMQVHPRLFGLGESAGQLVMPVATGLSRLPTSFSLGSQFSQGVRIPVGTLDGEASAFHRPCAIKIDVEGFELEVLAGGKAFLADAQPDIICEVLPSAPRVPEIETLLAPMGYRFLQYTDAGLVARPGLKANDEGRDWLFTAREDLSGHPLV